MATRKRTKPPVEYPEAMVALIDHYRSLPVEGRAVSMMDALVSDVSLRDWLVPEGTQRDLTAHLREWKTFKAWSLTDLSDPMPSVAHMIETKLRAQGVDFAQTPKGQRKHRQRDRTASTEQIDAYCDALLAMPEHAHCGWTFALRLMRYLGAGSDYLVFRERFEAAQQRAGVTSKRRRKNEDVA